MTTSVTTFYWAFGHQQDSTDQGFAADIQSILSELNEKLDRLDESESEHHEEVVERLDEHVLHLDDEDAFEFERDDIE